jgi:hypothetical protein
MKKILNYTNRKDSIIISGDNPEIKINIIEDDGETFFEPEIKFEENKFPVNSEIYIQPYTVHGYVGKPVYYGNVKEPLNSRTLEPYASKDELYFRVKIVQPQDDPNIKIKKVISFKDKIRSAGSKNLIQFGEADIDSIYEIRMKPNSIPIVMFKKGLGLKSDLKNSNYLKGIIFTGSVREILMRYIFDSDTFTECEVREDYVRHFKTLTKEPFPKKEDETDEIMSWIELALRRYSNYYVKKNKNLINIMPNSDVKIEEKLTY